jgi:long-chain acyl-CoA synthetase
MERIWVKNYDQGVAPSIDYPKITLHQILEESARRFPSHTAIIFPGALGDSYRLKYRVLDQQVNRLANALITLGVKKGDRVALLLPNCPQFVISYYAVMKAGGAVVATNPLYSPREMEHQLDDCGAETIISLSLFYKTVISVKDKTKLKNVIVTNIKEYLPPVSRLLFTIMREKNDGHRINISGAKDTYSFQSLLKGFTSKAPLITVTPDDIAMFQYTGGTTGTSKGAVALHRNVVANVYQMKEWANPVKPPEGTGVVMGVMPLFHVYGMITVMHLSILGGAVMVLLPRWDTKQVLKAINRYRTDFFPGVPTMYVALNNDPDIKKYNLRSIKSCVSGAAPLPLEVQNRFEEITGGKLSEGYGLSEAPVVVSAQPIIGKRKIGSIGVPFPDVEAKIMDAQAGEEEMPVGEVGELVIRAPHVMQGYWNRPEETKQVLRNGWLHTGDLARMDEDGYFYIVDRKKDMIIAGGYNIYPREVEEVLYEHPKVREAVCYGVSDPYRGETVKVCIVLKEGESATPEEITDFCRERLARFKVPKIIEFRESLPKSLIGKVLRRVLVEEEKAKQAATTKEREGTS